MALPALGAAAKFIMANGARAATMKFGKAAVDEAKDQIKKREKAVMKKADEVKFGVKKESSPQSIRRGQDTKRNKRVAKEERTSGRSDALRPPKDEMPLKFRKGGRSAVASAGKRKRPVFGGADSDAVIKIDRRNPVTARKEKAAKKAADKKASQAKIDAAVAKRTAKQKAERDAMMAKVKKDRPMPKRPSAISLANAADPKAKRPAKPQTPPKTKIDMPPADSRGKVTGKGGRNVGQGAFTRANVTKEQLRDSGMTLRQYLNFMDREGKRPPKKAMRGGMMKSKMKAKGMKAGGKMKAKGYMAGGKMKAKGMKAGGKMPMVKDPKTGKMIPAFAADGKGKMMAGGKVKSKGYAKGGMMKTKGYKAGGKMKAKGGATGGKKKVRGAGIARKGVRPAKMY